VFGTATEWFANEPSAWDDPDYIIGDKADGFRYMYSPISSPIPACYSSDTAGLEVHDAAQVGDHWFHLLAEGTNPTDGQPR
jgi:zinc metalloprotease ZmpA